MKKLFLFAAVLLTSTWVFGMMEKIQIPQMWVMGIECRTSNDPAVGPQQIGQHWQKFTNEGIFNQIPNKSSEEVIALYCEYDRDFTEPYSFVIGCKVSSLDEVPEGMVVKCLPAATYVVYPANGEYPQTLIDTWGTIWKSGIKRTYTGDFEVYGEKFYQTPQQVDVFVAVE